MPLASVVRSKVAIDAMLAATSRPSGPAAAARPPGLSSSSRSRARGVEARRPRRAAPRRASRRPSRRAGGTQSPAATALARRRPRGSAASRPAACRPRAAAPSTRRPPARRGRRRRPRRRARRRARDPPRGVDHGAHRRRPRRVERPGAAAPRPRSTIQAARSRTSTSWTGRHAGPGTSTSPPRAIRCGQYVNRPVGSCGPTISPARTTVERPGTRSRQPPRRAP